VLEAISHVYDCQKSFCDLEHGVSLRLLDDAYSIAKN